METHTNGETADALGISWHEAAQIRHYWINTRGTPGSVASRAAIERLRQIALEMKAHAAGRAPTTNR
jgi:hypothetical protein